MLRKEAEWVRKNVPGKLGGAPSADAQGESQGEGKEKRKENDKDEALRWQIEKCQKFVMTAPGPRGNKGPNNQQRELLTPLRLYQPRPSNYKLRSYITLTCLVLPSLRHLLLQPLCTTTHKPRRSRRCSRSRTRSIRRD